jgi:hypothetical protein
MDLEGSVDAPLRSDHLAVVSTNDSAIPYDAYVVEALRGVVARVMKETAARGRLVGEHHFFLTFLTRHPGVGIGPALRAQYPEVMKIVLQHVFEDLEADDEGFAVTLRFGGVPERLVVPWGALVEFRDPSVGLALGFPPVESEPEPEPEAPPPTTKGNVVTVDFGKKK